jgi:RNA polymerase sigma factor (sigma-70 family)
MTATPDGAVPEDAFATQWSRIERLHDGDAQDVWRWFVERYRPEILAMLRRRLPPGLAAEAEPEFWGYLFVSRAIARAERHRRFRPYLGGVVRNFSLAWRRQHERVQGWDARIDEVESSGERSLEQEELRAWARHTLRLALDAMAHSNPEQGKVLQWFYGLPAAEGDTAAIAVHEIAQRLGKSPAAIHQHLTRGRHRLRQCVENELREQVGSEADWRAEMALVFGSLATERPGLIPD